MTTNIHMFSTTEAHYKELDKFGKKTLNDKQLHSMAKINEATKYLIEIIALFSPLCADQTAAIRSARLAAMQANAAVCWDWPKEEGEINE